MYKGKKILALIPARGGSKGLPRKNIKPLLDKPLIAWTIKQAQESGYIDSLIVSTDSEEIASIAKRYGATVPFLRPQKLATDKARAVDVIFHAIDFVEKQGTGYDILVLLQPTSPLRIAKDIDLAIEQLFSEKAEAVVAVSEVDHHPYIMNTLPASRSMKNFIKPEIMNKNRQEFPSYYRINGAVYVAFVDYFRKNNGFIGNNTFAYVMPKERSVDIDIELDFKMCEVLLNDRKRN